MPCGQFAAHAVFFRLGLLAYNLCRGFQRWALQKEWRRHQVQTLRWRLYQIAGKVVRHTGRVYLKSASQLSNCSNRFGRSVGNGLSKEKLSAPEPSDRHQGGIVAWAEPARNPIDWALATRKKKASTPPRQRQYAQRAALALKNPRKWQLGASPKIRSRILGFRIQANSIASFVMLAC